MADASLYAITGATGVLSVPKFTPALSAPGVVDITAEGEVTWADDVTPEKIMSLFTHVDVGAAALALSVLALWHATGKGEA